MGILRGGPPLRVYHNSEFGWCIDVTTTLPDHAVKAAAKWAYKMNHDRWLSMRPGDQKERLGAALPSLRSGRIHQVVKSEYFEIGTD